jgi:hypothetical protein
MCETIECEPVLCELFCPHGFATDERGCEICACREPESDCRVGGCSGQLCYDPAMGGGISTCEWIEEYACYGSATCERQPDGNCGWTPTPELLWCLSHS